MRSNICKTVAIVYAINTLSVLGVSKQDAFNMAVENRDTILREREARKKSEEEESRHAWQKFLTEQKSKSKKAVKKSNPLTRNEILVKELKEKKKLVAQVEQFLALAAAEKERNTTSRQKYREEMEHYPERTKAIDEALSCAQKLITVPRLGAPSVNYGLSILGHLSELVSKNQEGLVEDIKKMAKVCEADIERTKDIEWWDLEDKELAAVEKDLEDEYAKSVPGLPALFKAHNDGLICEITRKRFDLAFVFALSPNYNYGACTSSLGYKFEVRMTSKVPHTQLPLRTGMGALAVSEKFYFSLQPHASRGKVTLDHGHFVGKASAFGDSEKISAVDNSAGSAKSRWLIHKSTAYGLGFSLDDGSIVDEKYRPISWLGFHIKADENNQPCLHLLYDSLNLWTSAELEPQS